MADSAYIHIPFCKSKCKYCSFVSFAGLENKSSYIHALVKDISFNYRGENLKTLYFGGGTPSLINIEELGRIIKMFNLNTDCEVTLEMNPDDADEKYLSALLELGVNRLSMGSQTFDDKVLKLIGRRHNSEDTIRAVSIAKRVGFKNISLDLIYGLPCSNITKDLDIILELGIQHVSTYGLKIEEGSYFYKHKPENLPDEDMQADIYLEINEKLSSVGYKRYEVSNFAIAGFESRHNLNYWNNEEYYGFGAAAHGYINGTRYSKYKTLKQYIDNPELFEYEHVLSNKEKLEEEIFLGFRKEVGIDVQKIKEKYSIDFDNEYKSVLEKFSQYIIKTPKGYKFTLEGVLLSNCILSEFI